MISFSEYLKTPIQEAKSPAPAPVNVRKQLEGLKAYLDTLKVSLPGEIDKLLVDLRNQIMNPNLPSKRGWWDGIKNWWNNLFQGREDKGNPYYWYNKIGELGRYESVENMGLEEYRVLHELALQLEVDVGGGPVPRVSKALGDWGTKAKAVLGKFVNDIAATIDNILAGMPTTPIETPTPAPGSVPSPGPTPSPAVPGEAPAKPAPTETPEFDVGPIEGRPKPGAPAPDTGPPSSDTAGGVPEAEEAKIATPEEIRNPANRDDVIQILRNMRHRPKKLHNKEEELILSLVWEPWNTLSQSRKRHLNNRGMNGQRRASNNSGALPIQIPWVLRKEDPRIEILKTYYPDIFDELMSPDNPQWRRIETDADTEDTVRERIQRFLARSNARTKGSPPEVNPPAPAAAPAVKKEVPKTVKIGGRPVRVDSLPPEVQATIADNAPETGPVEPRPRTPKTVNIGGTKVNFADLPPAAQQAILQDTESDPKINDLKDRIKKIPDLPEDIVSTLMDDLANGDSENVERWLKSLENAGEDDEENVINKFRSLEESNLAGFYKAMLNLQSWDKLPVPTISPLTEKYKKLLR